MYVVTGIIPGLRFRISERNGSIVRFPNMTQATAVAALHKRLFGYKTIVELYHPGMTRYETYAHLPEFRVF